MSIVYMYGQPSNMKSTVASLLSTIGPDVDVQLYPELENSSSTDDDMPALLDDDIAPLSI